MIFWKKEKGRAHLLTKRFDREGSDIKIHVHTLFGIQHFNYNNLLGFGYEQLFQTLRMLRLTYQDADLMTLANANNIKKGDKIINEIKEIVANWQDYAQRVDVKKE